MGAATSREQLDRAMSEAELLEQVRDLAALRGWLSYHTHNSRHSEAGFPDLVMVRDRRIIYAELKRESGQTTDEQRKWLCVLAEALAEVYVWRPSDWDNICEKLR